jgi:acetyl-CoA carboxylase carboxyl transferase subunit beta
MENQRIEILARDKRKDIPDGIWLKCKECSEPIYSGELSRNLRICPKCDYYFPLYPAERIALLADKNSFLRHDLNSTVDCPDKEICDQVIITGEMALSGHLLVMVAVNLGSAKADLETVFVCEKIIRSIDHAVERRLPLLLVFGNGDGDQEQNSMLCPAQELSTSAALSRLVKEKLLYISVLANANSHGDFPGFAYIADIVIVESNMPGPLRSEAQTNQNGSARAAQTLFQKGLVDMVVSRRELRQTLTNILKFFC